MAPGRLERALLLASLRVQRIKPPGLDWAVVLNARLVARAWRREAVAAPALDAVFEYRGRRLRLFRLGSEHADALFAFFGEDVPAEEAAFVPHRMSRAWARRIVGLPGLLALGVMPADAPDDTHLLGYGLCRPTLSGRALIAQIVSPRARGLGLGNVILGGLVDVAKQAGQLPYSIVYKSNARSMSNLREVGFRFAELGADTLVTWHPRDVSSIHTTRSSRA